MYLILNGDFTMKNSIYLLFAIIFIANLNATIIHVPASSDSIQGGIDFASDGDTVLVGAGQWWGRGVTGVSGDS